MRSCVHDVCVPSPPVQVVVEVLLSRSEDLSLYGRAALIRSLQSRVSRRPRRLPNPLFQTAIVDLLKGVHGVELTKLKVRVYVCVSVGVRACLCVCECGRACVFMCVRFVVKDCSRVCVNV